MQHSAKPPAHINKKHFENKDHDVEQEKHAAGLPDADGTSIFLQTRGLSSQGDFPPSKEKEVLTSASGALAALVPGTFP